MLKSTCKNVGQVARIIQSIIGKYIFQGDELYKRYIQLLFYKYACMGGLLGNETTNSYFNTSIVFFFIFTQMCTYY